jgi:hypothetical protein
MLSTDLLNGKYKYFSNLMYEIANTGRGTHELDYFTTKKSNITKHTMNILFHFNIAFL